MTARAGRRRWLFYENHREKLLPAHRFGLRVVAHAVLAFGLVTLALCLGAAGYHGFAHLGWIDSFLNASMILSGMGPVDPLPSDAAKIFASGYAIFSGVTFLSIVGLLLAPVLHRFLHRFHLEIEEEE